MKKSNIKYCLCVAVALLVTLLGSSQAAENSVRKALVPVNSGPATISDLHVLLDEGFYFQIFHFESESDFCLFFGYTHEVNGTLDGGMDSKYGGICDLAGNYRIIVKVKQIEDKTYKKSHAIAHYGLTFSVHDQETGTGGGVGSIPFDIEIGKSRGGGLTVTNEEIVFGEDIPLLTWRFTEWIDPKKTEERIEHDIHVTVRLTDNPEGTMGTP